MISKEKVESKSAKWKEKWDKRLKSKSGLKSLKWKNKWSKRQWRFSHNKSSNWNLKWERKAAKIARKFGKIEHETDNEFREMRAGDFYISSRF